MTTCFVHIIPECRVLNVRKEREERKEKNATRRYPAPSAIHVCLTVPNYILSLSLSLTYQFNKNTVTVKHTKFNVDPTRNNYSVDVDDDGANETMLCSLQLVRAQQSFSFLYLLNNRSMPLPPSLTSTHLFVRDV